MSNVSDKATSEAYQFVGKYTIVPTLVKQTPLNLVLKPGLNWWDPLGKLCHLYFSLKIL